MFTVKHISISSYLTSNPISKVTFIAILANTSNFKINTILNEVVFYIWRISAKYEALKTGNFTVESSAVKHLSISHYLPSNQISKDTFINILAKISHFKINTICVNW